MVTLEFAFFDFLFIFLKFCNIIYKKFFAINSICYKNTEYFASEDGKEDFYEKI